MEAIKCIKKALDELIDYSNPSPWSEIQAELQQKTLEDPAIMSNLSAMAEGLLHSLEGAKQESLKDASSNRLKNVYGAQLQVSAIVLLRAMAIGIRASEIHRRATAPEEDRQTDA